MLAPAQLLPSPAPLSITHSTPPLVPPRPVLERLHPVRYIILDHLFRLRPIAVLQLSKSHYQKYIPQLYSRVTITKHRVERWAASAYHTPEYSPFSARDALRAHTKTLRLCSSRGLQYLSALLLSHGEIFSSVGCLQISPKLFPRGANADSILYSIRTIINCPHINITNIALLLDPENHNSAKTYIACTCIAEIVNAGNLPIDTLTIHIPKIPIWKQSIMRDYVIDIGYLGLVWGSRNRLRLVFDLNARAYPTGGNVISFTSGIRYLTTALVPMLALPRYRHFKIEFLINDQGRPAGGGAPGGGWLVPEATWRTMQEKGPDTTRYPAVKMFWEGNVRVERVSGKETRDALELPC
ncbi:hypothetical protein L198_07323 [Cryptococcus wingfieldii CBS 7118]|uniref:Uncharacterized protein n=1 Tax=Cryptococcus wingfieldii CBS 7118 TaxID=1295528 RepID=A0A1E3ICY4_9TREE|nr:hypothetical protein L198_07323 [Cryptococcus wingfieldii CBS 7118]ODN86305.1 hypothetical protein L198_07323 [Cryptococcus wingfieldii CBS 7118]